MSLDETLFVGRPYGREPSFRLPEVMERHEAVRDAVAVALHGPLEAEAELWPLVASLSFVYAFNVYKALGLILVDRYYEAGSNLLRQLWETSLNLHWIEQDPDARSQDFCNFTTVEYRKQLSRRRSYHLDPENRLAAPSMKDFDQMTRRFQEKFFANMAGRRRPQKSFSVLNAEQRAGQLGDAWKREYGLLYDLGSNHAHGGPGAVLRPLFLSDSERREAAEIDATSLVALQSIEILLRDVRVLVRAELMDEPTDVGSGGGEVDPKESE